MKRILLTGGGSGGHLYPLMSVADAVLKTDKDVELIYIGPRDKYGDEFFKRDIKTYSIISSKLRRYFSVANLVDVPKFLISLIQALFKIYFIMPDVVFSKGGPGALPVLLAARFYMIPVVIHESDAVPSLTTRVSSRFAKKIDISFEETYAYFKKSNVTLTGNPIRESLMGGSLRKEEAKDNLGFEKNLPLILVLGGSLGSVRINQFIFDNFEPILKEYQVYHQVGASNFEEAKLLQSSLSREISSMYSSRYKLAGFLSDEEIKRAYSAADLVLSRSGSGTIFETSFFGKPSILVPLPESAGDHQKVNAYSYSKNGAASVIEEDNLKLNVVLTKIKDIFSPSSYEKMSKSAQAFSKPDAAFLIAKDILNL